MDIRFFQYIVWPLILISSGCTKYCYKDVQFVLPVSIYPHKEIYDITDTLWIEMVLPFQLNDQISDDEIPVGPYPFKVSMNILEILDSTDTDGFHSFEIKQSIGNLDTNGISFPRIDPSFEVFNEDGFQKWKFGLIPKKNDHTFLLFFSKVNFNGDWSGVKHFPQDDCDYAIDKSYYLTNEGLIDYESYLEKYPFIHNPGSSKDTIGNLRNSGAFLFSVK